METAYTVHEVHTQNLRNIIDVQFTPGKVVKISGKNGSGKSSIIESIFIGLCGTKVIERGIDSKMLVKAGADQSTIEVTISGPRTIKVTRKITASGNQSVEFRSSDGTKLYQKDVDEILSMTSIDPMQIISKNEKEQTLMIKEITGLNTDDIDEKINNKNGTLYLQRTDQGNRKRDAEAVLEEMGDVQFIEKVDNQEILSKIQEYNEHNSQQDIIQERIKNGEVEKQRKQEQIRERQNEIKRLQDLITNAQSHLNGYDQAIKELREQVLPKKETMELEQKIQESKEQNLKYELYQKWIHQNELVQKETIEYQNINEEIKRLNDEKLERIRKAKMPIEGLTIDEDKGIMINGLSMKHQYNTAQQIAFAMQIALSANPQLRLVYIKDGSLLDEDMLKVVCQQAEELQAQVFIERVGEEADTIIMRDGEMVN